MSKKPSNQELEKRILEIERLVDIGDARQDEERASERTFQYLVDNANDGIIVAVDEGSHAYANKRAADITGYSIPELLKLGFRDLVHPDEIPKLARKYRDRINGLNIDPVYESRIVTKTGQVLPIELSGARCHWFGKTADVVIIRDVSERKKAEESLQESQNMLQTVLDAIPSAVCWKDRNSVYLGANRAWLKATGLNSQADLVGKTDYDLPWKKEESDWFRKFDRKVMASGITEYDIIEHHHRADGTKVWGRSNKAPLRDRDGNVTGVLGTFEDITEEKKAQEALQQAHATLEARVKERTRELEMHKKMLEEVNTALNVMIEKRDKDREVLEEKVLINVEELIQPMINNLKDTDLNDNQKAYLDTLETFLKDITDPFSRTLHTTFNKLTLSEIKVANLIKKGKTTKEIAAILNSTPRAIEFHRQNIRKKLGINNRKANLGSHLLLLTQ